MGRLEGGTICSEDESEAIVQYLLRQGKDWDYVNCDIEALLRTHKLLEEDLASRFDKAMRDFEAENETAYQIKVQRVKGIFDRRIEQDRRRLQTLREANRSPRVINMTERRIEIHAANKEQRLEELKRKATIDIEQAQVAAGVFRVVSSRVK